LWQPHSQPFVKITLLDVTRLEKRYIMVKSRSQMRFEKTSGEPVDLESNSTYILFVAEDSLKIVFFLTHENLVKIMQERGLLPAKQ